MNLNTLQKIPGMSSPPRKKKRDGKKLTKNLEIPLVTTNRKKLDLLKTNKVNKSNMRKKTKTILTLLTIILTFKEVTPINVRHATKHVSVHAILGISNTTETELLVDKITSEIRESTKNTILKEKAEAYAQNIESLKADWIHDVIILLTNQKAKRGFKALGDLWADITDTASPEEWDKIKEIASDLTMVTTNQQKEIKHLQKKIVHNKNELMEYLHITQQQRLKEYGELRNAIYTNENITELSIKIDTSHIRAITIINHGNTENRIIRDIFEKSLLHLPSKYMFDPNTIRQVITKNAENDKKNSHIFYTKKEITDLYKFQSTMTAYDKDNNTLHSLLYLPLADYSDQMTTHPLPNLTPKDLNRLHALEDMTRLHYDLLLCSKSKNTIKLLASSQLEKCQKNIEKDTYICSGRQITLKMNQIADCHNINELPKTLASQTNKNEFVIQSSDENITIFCKNTPYKTILPKMCPIKLFIPNQCHIKSKTIEITIGDTTNRTKLINVKDENKIRITPIKNNNWTHIYKLNDIKPQKIPNKTDLNESKKLFELTDQGIKKAKKKINDLNDPKMSMNIGISSLSIAILTSIVSLIIIACLVHKGNCKTKPTEIETLELYSQTKETLIEIKNLNDKLESRIKTIIKNEMFENELEFENRLTNNIKQQILETIILNKKKETNENVDASY